MDEETVEDMYQQIATEFYSKLNFHPSERKNCSKKFNQYADKFQIFFNDYHFYCTYCGNHYYSQSKGNDINSFFQKHINTDYHKFKLLAEDYPDDKPIIEWEKWLCSGRCNLCDVQYIKAYFINIKPECRSLWRRHTCQRHLEKDGQVFDLFVMNSLKLFFASKIFSNKFLTRLNEDFVECGICEKKFVGTLEKTRYHLYDDNHFTNLIDFIKKEFKLKTFQILNAYNLENIGKWLLSRDFVIKCDNPKLENVENSLAELDDDVLLNGFYPGIVKDIIRRTSDSMIKNNICLICKKLTFEEFHFFYHWTKEYSKPFWRTSEMYISLANCLLTRGLYIGAPYKPEFESVSLNLRNQNIQMGNDQIHSYMTKKIADLNNFRRIQGKTSFCEVCKIPIPSYMIKDHKFSENHVENFVLFHLLLHKLKDPNLLEPLQIIENVLFCLICGCSLKEDSLLLHMTKPQHELNYKKYKSIQKKRPVSQSFSISFTSCQCVHCGHMMIFSGLSSLAKKISKHWPRCDLKRPDFYKNFRTTGEKMDDERVKIIENSNEINFESLAKKLTTLFGFYEKEIVKKVSRKVKLISQNSDIEKKNTKISSANTKPDVFAQTLKGLENLKIVKEETVVNNSYVLDKKKGSLDKDERFKNKKKKHYFRLANANPDVLAQKLKGLENLKIEVQKILANNGYVADKNKSESLEKVEKDKRGSLEKVENDKDGSSEKAEKDKVGGLEKVEKDKNGSSEKVEKDRSLEKVDTENDRNSEKVDKDKDGSLEKLENNKGRITEKVDKGKDGSLEKLENNKDGKLEKVDKDKEGSLEKLEKDKDGSLEKVDKDKDGSLEKVDKDEDGNSEKVDKDKEGSSEIVEKDKNGSLEKVERNKEGNLEKLEKDKDGSLEKVDTENDRNSEKVEKNKEGSLEKLEKSKDGSLEKVEKDKDGSSEKNKEGSLEKLEKDKDGSLEKKENKKGGNVEKVKKDKYRILKNVKKDKINDDDEKIKIKNPTAVPEIVEEEYEAVEIIFENPPNNKIKNTISKKRMFSLAYFSFVEDNKLVFGFRKKGVAQAIVSQEPIVIKNKPLNMVFAIRKYADNPSVKQRTLRLASLLNNPSELVKKMDSLVLECSLSDNEVEKLRAQFACYAITRHLTKKYPNIRFHIFGSRMAGLSSPDSDVDVFLDYGTNYYGFGSTNPQALVQMLGNFLIKDVECSKVVMVKNARIPIVSFFHKSTNLMCDVSFSNALSIHKTKLIQFFLKVDCRVKPLLLFLKYWAKSNSLHGSPNFTSYGICLVLVFYLQQLPSPILPSVETLQKNFTGCRNTIAGWDYEFSTDVTQLPPTNNKSSLIELLLGFFEFYAAFDYKKFVICPLTGTCIEKSMFSESTATQLPTVFLKNLIHLPLDLKSWVDKNFCVMDPLELSHIVTKTFTKHKLNLFVLLCKKSVNQLKIGLNIDQEEKIDA